MENTEENRVDAISGFLREAKRRLIPYNVFLSIDTFGYVCWNRNDSYIGQRLEEFAPISEIVQDAIRTDKIPGAVILIGNHNKVIYRRAFGYRELEPEKLPMTVDTIFDLASLTKVVATTTAIMQLAEAGKLSVEDAVAKYWPEFGANGKERITIRQLLTHYSGLRPDLNLGSE